MIELNIFIYEGLKLHKVCKSCLIIKTEKQYGKSQHNKSNLIVTLKS